MPAPTAARTTPRTILERQQRWPRCQRRGRLRGACWLAAVVLHAVCGASAVTAGAAAKVAAHQQHKKQQQQQQQEGVGVDVRLAFAPERFYNPSLVAYPNRGGAGGDTVWCAIKHTQHRKVKSKVWWLNTIQVCRGPGLATRDLERSSSMQCAPFHPWGEPNSSLSSSSSSSSGGGRTGLDECELDGRVRGGRTDSKGIGDTKLWVWPGKGVFAIFGHKPNRALLRRPHEASRPSDASTSTSTSSQASLLPPTRRGPHDPWALMRAHPALKPIQAIADTGTGGGADGGGVAGEGEEAGRFCTMQLVYHQWLVQVWPDPLQPPEDPWRRVGQDPLPLLPAPWLHAYPDRADQPFVMEKNWMPWVYKDQDQEAHGGGPLERLMVTYQVLPHTVWELLPNGTALPRWSTPSSDPLVEAKFGSFSVHGGPPVVWVGPEAQEGGVAWAGRSGSQPAEGYYLGIMHHIEKWRRGRLYRHFAYKFEARPPFRILAVSDELPLVYTGDKSKVAFVTGLHLSQASQGQARVYVTYGSADLVSRLLVLSVSELEALFSGHIRFREVGVDTDGAFALPGAGGGGGGGGDAAKAEAGPARGKRQRRRASSHHQHG